MRDKKKPFNLIGNFLLWAWYENIGPVRKKIFNQVISKIISGEVKTSLICRTTDDHLVLRVNFLQSKP